MSAILAATPLVGDAHARKLAFDLSVADRKIDDRAWDGCAHASMMLDRFFFNLAEPSPPDPLVLVVDESGDATEPRGTSCTDRLRCRFASIDVPDEVFGLVFLDRDATTHDLIDAVVVVPAKVPRWLPNAHAMEQAVRRVVALVAPDGVDLCRPLRMPNTEHVSVAKLAIGECAPESPCELRQSLVSITDDAEAEGSVDPWAW